MDLQQRQELDRAEFSGYLPHIRSIVQSATAALWWSRSSSPIGSAVLHNGTICAINTGVRTICVTAGHVYSQYLRHKEEFPDIECQIGSVRINLEDYLIDIDHSLDLATFDISPILLASSHISVHGAPHWPPSRLLESDIVILGGYPGMLRIEQLGKLGTPFVSFITRVAQTSVDHSAVQLNLEDSYWPDGSGGVAPQSELGGMSGGPVFRFRSKNFEYLELAGFIYEASTSYGLLFARHASCISSKGEIISDA